MPTTPLALAALVALLALAPSAEAASDPSRFRVQAELHPLLQSDDGRFALRAEARFTAASESADQRFRLKATRAECAPLTDALFANGFE